MIGRYAVLRDDIRGVTIVEFALVSPVLFMMLLGGLELGHTSYVRSILQGQVQKAARDISLEDASTPARQQAIEDTVRNSIRDVVRDATVGFDMEYYRNYSNAKSGAEDFNDANHNGRCDAGEAFVDANRNGVWDAVYYEVGRGGAKDVVKLTVTVTYPRLPLGQLFASSPETKLTASTYLRNQPFDKQATAPMLNCT